MQLLSSNSLKWWADIPGVRALRTHLSDNSGREESDLSQSILNMSPVSKMAVGFPVRSQ